MKFLLLAEKHPYSGLMHSLGLPILQSMLRLYILFGIMMNGKLSGNADNTIHAQEPNYRILSDPKPVVFFFPHSSATLSVIHGTKPLIMASYEHHQPSPNHRPSPFGNLGFFLLSRLFPGLCQGSGLHSGPVPGLQTGLALWPPANPAPLRLHIRSFFPMRARCI